MNITVPVYKLSLNCKLKCSKFANLTSVESNMTEMKCIIFSCLAKLILIQNANTRIMNIIMVSLLPMLTVYICKTD